MNNIITENEINLDNLKNKYPGDDFVIVGPANTEGDTLFDTWYITLDENTNIISRAWKQVADDDW